MRLHVLSDLHLEFAPFTPQSVAADAVILAGDIAGGVSAIAWADKIFGDVPVIYVPGNHEVYGFEAAEYQEALRHAADQTPGVTVCHGVGHGVTFYPEGETPVRILGTTLWTDFALFSAEAVETHGLKTQHALADYRAIRVGRRLLNWADTLGWHQAALAWLTAEIEAANSRGERVVVVTHHAPSLRSSALCFRDDPVTSGFASNLEDLASESVDLWIHGHMHNSSDYRMGRCRVIANPRGYPLQRWNPDTPYENREFNPALVVEI